MAGLVRPRMFPIRSVTDDKQDTGIVYNPHRMAGHGGFTSTDKYPKGDTGFREVDPPTNKRSAEVSNKSLNE